MLNLDLLGGISFEKGCYTGQEIIARTHFRGAIKRRMFRFECACPPPAPGTRSPRGEQHAGDVVDAAATSTGCELLAVISLAQQDAELELETARRASRCTQAAAARMPCLRSGFSPTLLSGRMCGNSSTSRIDGEFVSSITSRSMPTPSPAVGGMPYSSARM